MDDRTLEYVPADSARQPGHVPSAEGRRKNAAAARCPGRVADPRRSLVVAAGRRPS